MLWLHTLRWALMLWQAERWLLLLLWADYASLPWSRSLPWRKLLLCVPRWTTRSSWSEGKVIGCRWSEAGRRLQSWWPLLWCRYLDQAAKKSSVVGRNGQA